MPRRTHKKSRNGCVECKRRHVKCDERRPICSNCVASERRCQFAGPAPTVSSAQASPSTSHEITSTSPATSSPAQQPTPAPSGGFVQDAPVNLLHVELFHNILLEGANWVNAHEVSFSTSFPDLLRIGLEAPYLLNMMLAISALNLSIVKPDRRDYYRHHATQLQSHALNNFNSLSPHFDRKTCIPMFLFAAILGLHFLCETLVFREGPFESFLDRFVQYLRLHQGIRTITAEGRWEYLQETSIKPFLTMSERLPPMDSKFGPVCESLYQRIEGSEKSEARLKVYRQTIQALQMVMTALDSEKERLGALVAWPVIVSPDYVDLVASHQGEALVILAYYGALIHPSRNHWVFQDGGQFLIESVTQYLGPAWHDWLEWPWKALT
ncbi:Putative Sterol uptake control protein 2 [Penicillium brasilianum]|uniref:Putative Sterol uptake control protein 2 n=1 Tax=Penicillium brasilianum TaxID=104259 RepID=A0A0F7TYN8_PENBI|nr:Putative Sterol uptake control protein 2 [Penicillium brasilianum]